MLFLQRWRYAAVLRRTRDDTGSQVLHTLQLLDCIFWCSIQKRVAIINSGPTTVLCGTGNLSVVCIKSEVSLMDMNVALHRDLGPTRENIS